MRMIDADRLKAEIMGWCVVTDDLFGMGKYHEREIVLQAIEESPAISAAPVVRGEWICNPDDKKFSLVCSVCGQVMPFIPEYLPDNPPFCNCGAKMESEGST